MIEIILKIKEKFLPDKKFRKARIWSNDELRKISSLFFGDVINVSGWKDDDKRGGKYRDYFPNACTYSISNYEIGEMAYQGGEVLLNLEKDLLEEFKGKYDVVFSHTVLEHIFEIGKAFENLCLLSRDVVITVVPFLQEMHYSEGYKDYWRFTPFALQRLFEKNGMEMIHCVSEDTSDSSIYVLAVGSKKPAKWKNKISLSNDIFLKLGEKIIK